MRSSPEALALVSQAPHHRVEAQRLPDHQRRSGPFDALGQSSSGGDIRSEGFLDQHGPPALDARAGHGGMQRRWKRQHHGVDAGERSQIFGARYELEVVLLRERAARGFVGATDGGQSGSGDIPLQQVPGVAAAVRAESGQADAQRRAH